MKNAKTYYLSEASLGDEGTEDDARRMVDILKGMGYDAEYTNVPNSVDSIIPFEVWDTALGILSDEMLAEQEAEMLKRDTIYSYRVVVAKESGTEYLFIFAPGTERVVGGYAEFSDPVTGANPIYGIYKMDEGYKYSGWKTEIPDAQEMWDSNFSDEEAYELVTWGQMVSYKSVEEKALLLELLKPELPDPGEPPEAEPLPPLPDVPMSLTEDQLERYSEEMRKGHYFTALDIILRSRAPEGISDEELYKPIVDTVLGASPFGEEPEP